MAAAPDWEELRERARQIKEHTITHLDFYLEQLVAKVSALGGKVYWAETGDDVCRYIVELARDRGVKSVVKSKSMTTEEIGLNPALSAAGVEPVETDLGEYIVQLRRETPSHIITPAIHLAREDIGRLFAEKLGIEYTPEPERLTAAARERLRSIFLSATMGVTGVNFAIAETGTLVLVENEGNGRFSSTLPDTLVAIMGIEKVIPKLADLSHFLEVLARTATGQKLTCYTNFINGPRRTDDLDGPREVHVVMLDNGRSRMLADPVLREALYCLRCGACLNVCPVYRRIGGHAYGFPYSGPIGSIISPNLFGSAAAQLPFASTLCGACREICPVKIDIPRILLHLRWKEGGGDGAPPVHFPPEVEQTRRAARRFGRAALHPALMRSLMRVGGVVTRPFSRDGYLRRMPGAFRNWTRTRDFRAPRSRT